MSMGIGYSGANPDGAPVAVLRTGRRPIRSVRRAICALLTYPIAGWLGGSAGLSTTSIALAAITCAGVVVALTMGPLATRRSSNMIILG